MPKYEDEVLAEVLRAIGGRSDTRLFRNQVGSGFVCRPENIRIENLKNGASFVHLYCPRRVSFGLCEGSPDFIGFKEVTITPDMVGKKLAVFVGLECKGEKGKPSEKQELFLNMLNKFNAIGGVVRSKEEAEALIRSKD